MRYNLPATSRLAQAISLLPVEEDQPSTNPALGSLLSRCICIDITEVEDFDALIWNPSFCSPKHTSERLQYLHLIDCGMLIKNGVTAETLYLGEIRLQRYAMKGHEGLRKPLTVKAKRYWCSDCKEYRNKKHECTAPSPTPQDLSVNLITRQWEELHELRLNPPKRRKQTFAHPCEPVALKIVKVGVVPVQPFDLYSFTDERSPNIIKNQRVASKAAVDYLPTPKCKHADIRSFTFSTGETITLCPDCGHTNGHDVLKQEGWEFPPPPPFCPDEQYLRWANYTFLTPPITKHDGLNVIPFEVWQAERCLLQLNRVGLTMSAGRDCDHLCYKGSAGHVDKISDARQVADLLGKRVRKAVWEDDSSDENGGDRNAADGRGDTIARLKENRVTKRVGRKQAICKWKVCSVPFVPTREGHVYHTDNCRRRDNEGK